MSLCIDSPSSFVVENELLRLEAFLKLKLQISSNHIGRCLEKEWILVNQKVRTHKSAILATGDTVTANATAFQISQVRFERPLLRTMYKDKATYTILWKPAGMPHKGKDSETVFNALPASMLDTNYEVVDCVSRIASGPVIVTFDNVTQQQLLEVDKRYTFVTIVHGTSPDRLDMTGFLSLQILQTITSTTGDLTMVQVILTHSGDGLRGCLLRNGCPILGTSARTKSKTNGCFLACTKLELFWNEKPATVVEMGVPDKFQGIFEREQRFYEIKQQREAEKDQRQQKMRRDYMDRNGGTADHLLSNHWSVAAFCGLFFYVTNDVMTPKPSSEVLIQSAKEYLPQTCASVLDLGTGSGCLLVSMLVAARQIVRGVGVDISTEALKVAEINIQSHGLSDRAVLQQGDFNDLTFLSSDHAFDVILCNPPYLTEGECEKDGLLGPRVALVAARKGLACYEMVARQVASFLKPNGVVVLEVGGKRKVDEIRVIFQGLDHVETRLDDQGRERCLVLRKYNPMALTESKVPPQD